MIFKGTQGQFKRKSRSYLEEIRVIFKRPHKLHMRTGSRRRKSPKPPPPLHTESPLSVLPDPNGGGRIREITVVPRGGV